MANFLSILGKIFGNKYDKDIKQITPIVDEINKEYENLANITHDELRKKTIAFKQQINDFISEEKLQIQQLTKKASLRETNTEDKESLYRQIENHENTILEKTEEILNTILPRAFAVVKETARRFAEHESITVTASENDKELAANKDFISIKEHQAIYSTSWDAAGTKIKWDMIHYDVQLIGGIVLHQGKIAEMQTGEGKT